MAQELLAAGLAQGRITLKTAADHINALHAEATNYAKASLVKAKEAGAELARAKMAIKHGAFEAWVNETCNFSVRTARKYMEIHRDWDLLLEKLGPGQMSIINLEQGIAKLTQVRKEKKAEIAAHTIPAEAVDEPGDCIKGGDHEWETDYELPGHYCAKCHEQRPPARQAADEDDSGDTAAGGRGAEEEADEGVAAGRVGSDSLARLEKMLKEAVDLTDQAYQENPSPLRESVLTSLSVAYEDVLKWRKK